MSNQHSLVKGVRDLSNRGGAQGVKPCKPGAKPRVPDVRQRTNHDKGINQKDVGLS